MENTVLAALMTASAALGGAILTGIGLALKHRQDTNAKKIDVLNRKIERLEKTRIRLLWDLEARFFLEEELHQYIADCEGKTSQTIKNQFRARLRELGKELPVITYSQLQRYLRHSS
jgi:hypothetical protein